jgi:hypothetical protein
MSRTLDMELFLIRMLAMSPMFVVMLIGFLMAIKRIPRYPRNAWALMGSLILSAINNTLMPLMMQVVFQVLDRFQSTNQLWLRTVIYTIPPMIVACISWGLIFVAVFDEKDRRILPPEDDPDRDILDR